MPEGFDGPPRSLSDLAWVEEEEAEEEEEEDLDVRLEREEGLDL